MVSGDLQPRPQGLPFVQNGGRRNPWPRLLKYSKNRGVSGHVTHGFQRMAALFVFCNWKLLFKRNEDISLHLRDEILTNFLEPLSQPWPGVSPTAILNEEKALGMRVGGLLWTICTSGMQGIKCM